MDRIHGAEALTRAGLAPGFSLEDYAAQSFGVYQDPDQYDEVIWRFLLRRRQPAPRVLLSPEADRRGAGRWQPHRALPRVGVGRDGMAFYQWGDTVEVIAPEALRNMVHGHRRSDFGAMPWAHALTGLHSSTVIPREHASF